MFSLSRSYARTLLSRSLSWRSYSPQGWTFSRTSWVCYYGSQAYEEGGPSFCFHFAVWFLVLLHVSVPYSVPCEARCRFPRSVSTFRHWIYIVLFIFVIFLYHVSADKREHSSWCFVYVPRVIKSSNLQINVPVSYRFHLRQQRIYY